MQSSNRTRRQLKGHDSKLQKRPDYRLRDKRRQKLRRESANWPKKKPDKRLRHSRPSKRDLPPKQPKRQNLRARSKKRKNNRRKPRPTKLVSLIRTLMRALVPSSRDNKHSANITE